jgi:hypothetical protein
MAIEKIINLVSKLDDKGLQEAEKGIQKVDKSSQNLEKQNKQTAKSAGFVSRSLGLIGTALKALGIGLVIGLFVKLGEVFSRNQRFVDFFSTSMEVLNIAFNDFFNFLADNFQPTVDFFKDVFENPLENIKALGVAIQDNLIERFNSLLKVFGFLSAGVSKLFDKDFKGAFDAFNMAGKESIDVITGVNDSVEKVGEVINKVTEGVTNYAKETLNAAKANIDLQNAAQLAAAQQGLLVEKFDRLAEKQRQIRDEERNSIDERIAANNALGEILEDQEKALIAQANAQVAAAQANVNTNKSIETQVALTEALSNRLGVLAQVEGFRSEQLVNDLALKREQIQLDQSIAEGEKTRQLAQLDFEASQALTEAEKLILKKESLELENQIILADLERKKELFKQGTQARVDAEQEFLTAKQDIDNESLDIQRQINEQKILDEQNLEDAKRAILMSAIDTAINGFALLGQLAGKNKALQAAALVGESLAGIARIVINTQAANAAAVLKYALIPGGVALAAAETTINKVSAGIGIAANLLATKKALASLGGGGGVSASPVRDGGGGQSAPAFNVVGNSDASRLGQTINERRPIKAFVVGNDVTTQQEMDRNTRRTATIG